jgi:large subunit ribosomal protein L18
MEKQKETKAYFRSRRHRRVRKKIAGTTERPRLVVFRSLRHIYGQLVDDSRGVTLMGISSMSPSVQGNIKDVKGKVGTSKLTGKALAEKAIQSGVESVVFDRGGYKYHGRIRAFAEGAREGGLKF